MDIIISLISKQLNISERQIRNTLKLLANGALLQQAVSLDDELRSCSLESYTSLDTDDGVTHVAVATSSSTLFSRFLASVLTRSLKAHSMSSLM